MALPPDQELVLHGDPEHGRLRAVVVALLVFSYGIGFLIINRLLQFAPGGLADFSVVLSCVGAIPLSLGLVGVAETFLKQRWHSGITVTLDDRGIEADLGRGGADGDSPDRSLSWARPINFLGWYFSLKGYARGGRERRIPSSWLCLACELLQDEVSLVVYTYLPPERLSNWLATYRTLNEFEQIFPAELYESSVRGRLAPPSRPTVSADVLRGQHGRHWLGEKRRWQEGIELVADDYEQWLVRLERSLPQAQLGQ